ncbi:MAG: DUF1553 domain-containing protein, partial [Planctomycetes bacterium]|nr:DUF1553 domain-containing protein [Planctomycetota bacterium]
GVDFAPLLDKHRGTCHIGDARQGGFSLSTREDAIAGGDSEQPGIVPGAAPASEFIVRITSTDPDTRMPSEGDPLPAKVIAVFRRWIEGQAPWEPGFAFRRSTWEPPLALRAVPLPPAEASRTDPVDRACRQVGAARSRTTGRGGVAGLRSTLALVLEQPAPQRLHRHRLHHRRPTTDHHLAPPFARGQQGLRSFCPRVDRPTEESRGFVGGIVWRGTVNASQIVPIQFAQKVSQSCLGINLNCASRHDSFVDRWTLRQTYDLAAITSSQPLELHRCEQATGQQATPGWPFAELGQVDPQAPPARRLEQLAELLTKQENGWLSRNLVNLLWARLLGRGLVHPVDALRLPPWNEDLLDVLAADLVDAG